MTTTLDALDRYAHAVGLAFQVRDDILDVEGESAVIGKTAGKDAAADKPTFPSIIGLDASRARLARTDRRRACRDRAVGRTRRAAAGTGALLRQPAALNLLRVHNKKAALRLPFCRRQCAAYLISRNVNG